ncbi:MAG: M3 family oligoendopeptidase [alpha proteobacterium HIMB59]|nr:MAG: M3 family oligoendopeptidase [alpha proteobacterium HIMB59]|tara:strand:+ start:23674 stop:25425 length:1752 start_codon:yes stop_codon:yes gene_type:complete
MSETLPNWNLKDFYLSIDDKQIEKDLELFKNFTLNFSNKYKDKLLSFALDFEEIVKEYEDGNELGDKLGNYAFLIYATNMNDQKTVQFYQGINEKLTEISSNLIFFTNEINSSSDNDFEAFKNGSGKYKNWLINLRRFKDHQLDQKSEKIFLDKNLTSNSSWVRFFEEQINDLKFEINGKEHNSSDALNLLSDHDEEIRKKAALSIESVFQTNVKTFTFITNTLAKDKITNDKWRNYTSPVESRNLANNVEGEVVDALTKSVTSNYKNISHRYYEIKSKLFNKKQLDYWDRNAPYPNSPKKLIQWEEAKDIVLRSYENFDQSFKDIVLLFFQNNWIDAELKSGKSPGAFAASTIPSIHPYILTNFHGKTRDVMTLAHELGHGCHQYLSSKQGLLLSSTPLTLAETASVFGEMMTFRTLLDESDKDTRKFLLASKIEDMINTVVRQISFFEFEKLVHNERKNIELSSDQISDFWMTTQSESLGPHIKLSEGYKYFWTYIPHFIHTPFYVYAYAFGDCLVNILIQLYDEGLPNFKNHYIDLLKSGGSKHYSQVLKPFNVDLTNQQSWQKGLSMISGLIDEFEKSI